MAFLSPVMTLGLSLLVLFTVGPPHALAGKLDPMGVMRGSARPYRSSTPFKQIVTRFSETLRPFQGHELLSGFYPSWVLVFESSSKSALAR